MGLPALAVGATVLGTGLGIAGTLQQGEVAERAAEFNADLAEVEGRQKEGIIRRRGRKDLGRIRAAIGKAGVTTEGSPMEVLAESAANTELDALNAAFNTRVEAAGLRAGGKAARRGSRLSAAAQLLSGAGSAAGVGYQTGVIS